MRMIARVRSLLFVVVLLSVSAMSFGQIGIAVNFGPPALPVYEQPLCPAEGYIWTPGYWAWDPDAGQYYWVPGTWVLAPQPGYLWTPPWWGWGPGGFLFHAGFWGIHVGFYGGINYGFGYFGNGFEGGRWQDGHFFYNRSVNNINVTNIHNVYNTTVINNNVTVNRVSYNGGPGGLTARPTAAEQAVEREQHIPPVAAQNQHVEAARSNPEMRESANHGKPPIAATAKPGEFRGEGVVPAKEAGEPYKPVAARSAGAGRPENNVPRPPTHAADLAPHQASHPNTGNADRDQKYAQQQEKLANKQNQEHQKLQQKQQAEDQRLAQRNAADAQRQQTEQRHAQQTQQLEQRHQQQTQHLQQRQSPPPAREGAPPRK